MEGDGQSLNPAIPYQSFSGVSADMYTFNFTTPFPVTEATTYSFAIRGGDVSFDGSPNPVLNMEDDGLPSFLIGGQVGYISRPDSDLYFRISNADTPLPPPPPPAPPMAIATTVPTMSQWGMLIFGLVVLNLSLIFIYRLERIYTSHGVKK